MKKLVWLGLMAAVLAGCQGGDPPAAEATQDASTGPSHARVATVPPPSSTEAGEIAVVLRPDRPIKVGMPADDVTNQLKDPKLFSFGSDKLPAKFDYPYRVQTWESSRYGFGTITYDGIHIVGLVYEQDKFTQDRVDDIVKAHKDQMPNIQPNWIQGKHVNYWFWEGPKQRVMVCAFDSGRNGIQLTVAMGDDVVMDALGINPQAAQRDGIVADTMMNHAGAVPKPATPGS